MKKTAFIILSVIVLNSFFLQTALAQEKSIAQKVDSVLKLMTLDEKVGQLNQYNDDWRLKIPLIFGQDVIHGYKTTFPIP